MIPADRLAELKAAADEWQAAPIGSVAEQDAAGGMYEAAYAVLAAAGYAGLLTAERAA